MPRATTRWRLAAEQGLSFVHPFDDALVIAGQGTIGLEMLRVQPSIDTLLIAVGGGGLISGHRHRGACAEAGPGHQWACRPSASRRCSTPSRARRTSAGRQHHRRRHRGGAAGRLTRQLIARARGRPGAGRRRRPRAGRADAAGDREDGRRRRRCGRPGGAAEAARRVLPAATSAWCCAAATSTRCCWRRSSSAAWCAPGGWRASAWARATIRACWRASPPWWPRPAPTSTRCTTSAPSARCRRRTSRSNWCCRRATPRTWQRWWRRCRSAGFAAQSY
jgi:hypothetical protein